MTRLPCDAQAAFREEPDRLGVQPVLLDQNARGQRVLRVAGSHRHRRLQHDGTGVDALVDEVHGGARHLHAVLERLALGVQARERRQQRGMDVEARPAKART